MNMRNKHAHLSDEELLLFIDRELSSRREARAREHLAQCPPCCNRRNEIENTLAEAANIHEDRLNSLEQLPIDSHFQLRARMAETAIRTDALKEKVLAATISRQLACACIALLLVAGGVWALKNNASKGRSSKGIRYQISALPRRELTPGNTRAIRIDELCRTQNLDNDPPASPSLETAVFREYGLPDSSRHAYDLDYLVTPALGGTNNIQNLWPQPRSSTPWNAKAKDQLEDRLHELVCEGKVQLATAQKDIAGDWIAAYQRYFDTDNPQSSFPTRATVSRKRIFGHRHRARLWSGDPVFVLQHRSNELF